MRRGTRSDGDRAADRVGALLRPAGGWVPPPDEPPGRPAGGWLPPPDEASDRQAGRWVPPPDAASDRQAGGWVPPPDAAPTAEPSPDEPLTRSAGGWVPPPDDPPAPDPSPEPPPASRSPAPSWQREARPVVPGRHAGGWRLDPGRRGAAALVAVALAAAAVASLFVLRGRPQEVALPAVEAAGVPLPDASAAPGGEVVVSVGGLVVRPGLVRLPAGSRVDDAVRAAGGPAVGADVGLLNLARVLVDGEQVLVGVAAPAGTAAAPGGRLDLNTATAGDLDALPGIGPVLAQRIVDWRTEHGRFASVDQLREVKGIGEATYAELEAEVTV